jgi:hypothetical protein
MVPRAIQSDVSAGIFQAPFFLTRAITPDLESCQSPFCLMTITVLAWAMLQFDIDWMENSIQS